MAAAAIAAEGPGKCFEPAFARANPSTVITDCLPALCLGGSAIRPVIEAAAWIAALLAVTVPAAISRYRHAAST
ncbi:MAG TPA: hypothetical protein VEH31_45525 [Streptosporangiaceae bacterium]|nr:hypothetical protein [Streptosporangiaceae bacterium]